MELIACEELMDELDRDRALADGRGDAVHRALPDVPCGEDTRHVGLERERAAFERPGLVVLDIRSSENEPAVPPRELLWEPVSIRVGADHEEERIGPHRL